MSCTTPITTKNLTVDQYVIFDRPSRRAKAKKLFLQAIVVALCVCRWLETGCLAHSMKSLDPRHFPVSSYLSFDRVVSTVVVTARNVTYALAGAPDSSSAYESGDKILSMIKESDDRAELEETGSIKMVNIKWCM